MSDALKKQGNALENRFFQQVDEKLLEQLRQKLGQGSKREALASVANVTDPQVLDALLALNVDATTFAALMFVPLAEVAWADGTLDVNERKAILQAAEQHGIIPGNPGYKVLQQWLDQPVHPELVTAWRSYVLALKHEVDPPAFASVRDEILGLAERVARASGGILGMNAISAAEKQKLAELAAAFDAS